MARVHRTMRRTAGVGACLVGACGSMVEPALAQPMPASDARAEVRERAALLAQTLPEAVRARSFVALPPLLMVTGATMGAMGIAARSPAMVAGGAVALAGGVGFYFMPEQRDHELLAPAASASLGLFYLGLDLPEPHQRWQIPLSVGWFGTSAIGFVNWAYSTNPGKTRLLRDLERVRSPRARASLGVEELRQIERDLYATEYFVPQWAVGLPLIVASATASAPIFDKRVATRDKSLTALLAAGTLVQGLLISFVEQPASQYRSSLEKAGLSLKWGVGPDGVSVVGSFD